MLTLPKRLLFYLFIYFKVSFPHTRNALNHAAQMSTLGKQCPLLAVLQTAYTTTLAHILFVLSFLLQAKYVDQSINRDNAINPYH